jgi:hypothetical protein
VTAVLVGHSSSAYEASAYEAGTMRGIRIFSRCWYYLATGKWHLHNLIRLGPTIEIYLFSDHSFAFLIVLLFPSETNRGDSPSQILLRVCPCARGLAPTDRVIGEYNLRTVFRTVENIGM